MPIIIIIIIKSWRKENETRSRGSKNNLSGSEIESSCFFCGNGHCCAVGAAAAVVPHEFCWCWRSSHQPTRSGGIDVYTRDDVLRTLPTHTSANPFHSPYREIYLELLSTTGTGNRKAWRCIYILSAAAAAAGSCSGSSLAQQTILSSFSRERDDAISWMAVGNGETFEFFCYLGPHVSSVGNGDRTATLCILSFNCWLLFYYYYYYCYYTILYTHNSDVYFLLVFLYITSREMMPLKLYRYISYIYIYIVTTWRLAQHLSHGHNKNTIGTVHVFI